MWENIKIHLAGLIVVIMISSLFAGLGIMLDMRQKEWNSACLSHGGTLILDGSFRGPCIVNGVRQ